MQTFNPWWLLIRRLSLVMIVYTLLRLFFLVDNWNYFQDERMSDILGAFLHGLRFDLWTVGWIFLPIIITSFLPWSWQKATWIQRATFAYFIACNLAFITINVVDAEWFKFTGRRVTLAWFHLQQDIQSQAWTMVSYYWSLSLLVLVTCGLLWWSYPKMEADELAPKAFWKRIFEYAIVAICLFTALRGGYQFKPLGLNDAYAVSSADIGALTINSTFSLIKNRKVIDSIAIRFLNSDDEAYHKTLDRKAQMSAFRGSLSGYNVVVIIVESLPSEYVGALNLGRPTYTPFLDELSQKAILFQANFANGRRSVEAVPSVMCSFPSMMSEALVLSPYQGIRMYCLGHALHEAGYSTLFFHGAYNGSMHVDAMAKRAGFESFYGYNEFPDKSYDDGNWGIFDEPMLDFAIDEINRNPKPFGAAVFTLTSHSPYRVPDHLVGKFPKGTLEAHESIGYVDFSLRQFFAKAEKQDWFNKTVFIITGDHTHKSEDPKYADFLGYYRVPLIVYIPGRPDLNANRGRITQHLDIFPTVVDLLGLDLDSIPPFGSSIFNESPGMAYSGNGASYFYFNPDWLVFYNITSKSFAFVRRNGPYKIEPFTGETHPDPKLEASRQEALEALKARVHYFNWAVSNNRLYSGLKVKSVGQ